MQSSPNARTCLLAGSTGLVGRELLAQLIEGTEYARVHSLVRRPSSRGSSSPKLIEQVVDFDHLPALPGCDDVYVALGTTIQVAGSESAFRHVDYDYVVGVAKAARLAGATRLGVVSALGAAATSRVFYNRVKGEMEAAVTKLDFDTVAIAQPSLLLGNREQLGQPTRAGEVWARRLLGPVAPLIPASFRPVRAEDVAAALIAAVLRGERRTVTIASREMHAFSKR